MVPGITFFAYPDPLIWWQLALVYLAIGWGAFIIGCFGVGGGAVMVPVMLFLPGVTPAVAVPTVFVGTSLMSATRTFQLYRMGRLDIASMWPMMVGAAGGAALGQLLLPHIYPSVIAFGVAAIAIYGGAKTQQKVLRDWRAQQAAIEKQAADDAGTEPATIGNRSGASASSSSSLPPADEDELNQTVAEERAVARAQTGSCMEGLACLPMPCPAAHEGSKPAKEVMGGGPASVPDRSSLEAVTEADAEIQAADAAQGSAPMTDSSCITKRHVVMIAIAFFCSVLSSLSGTGGPLILFPVWLLWEPQVEMKTLVANSSPFATVMVATSALVGLLFGEVDVGIAIGMNFVSMTCVVIGGLLMERLGNSCLKLSIGVVLVVIGIVVSVRTLLTVI
eukprot:gb/GFBE01013395.1/.p1 GENE.gb/GFBE01013395.1/~~gb/GFBE01013395.1/.p1  ORF type:complete len:392 (+),score=54.99 gb/GFBE01013395.1/:1-1176(+)